MIFKLIALFLLILNIWYLTESVTMNEQISIFIHSLGAIGAGYALFA
jgi:hypothetical protein